METGLFTDAIIVNFSEAFVKGRDEHIRTKLLHNGITGNTRWWTRYWLLRRQQRVVIDWESSEPSSVTSGVTQENADACAASFPDIYQWHYPTPLLNQTRFCGWCNPLLLCALHQMASTPSGRSQHPVTVGNPVVYWVQVCQVLYSPHRNSGTEDNCAQPSTSTKWMAWTWTGHRHQLSWHDNQWPSHLRTQIIKCHGWQSSI